MADIYTDGVAELTLEQRVAAIEAELAKARDEFGELDGVAGRLDEFDADLEKVTDKLSDLDDLDKLQGRVDDLENDAVTERDIEQGIQDALRGYAETDDLDALETRYESTVANLEAKGLDETRAAVQALQALTFLGRLRWLLTGRLGGAK